MKKNILFVVCILALAGAASAQVSKSKGNQKPPRQNTNMHTAGKEAPYLGETIHDDPLARESEARENAQIKADLKAKAMGYENDDARRASERRAAALEAAKKGANKNKNIKTP